MNITHIKDSQIEVPENIFQGIFDRQRELHEKYREIEQGNRLGLSLVKDIPFSLDNPKWQYILKDFAWRVTEEMAEAREAYLERNDIHYVEELIDALHFYTEMLVICQWEPDNLDVAFRQENPTEYMIDFWLPVYHLGIACNFLKCKPWKNTHVITDKKRFIQSMLEGYTYLVLIILKARVNGNMVNHIENLYMLYFKKSLVNQFRQETNY